jgi:serine protease inhibitor
VKGNLVSSPLSCQMALSMLHPGAKGKTAKSLAEALCLPGNVELGQLISKMKVKEAN